MRKFHSQCGEDKWIVDNLNPPKMGYFVDVGASDGIYLSNTYYFESIGWDGICFEPNARSFPRAYGVRNNVVKKCIGLENKIVTFNLDIKEPDLSGIKTYGREYEKYEVEMMRMDTAIETYKIPHIDLLSIDTEGTELDVLGSFDIKTALPTIIIVEHFSQRVENAGLTAFFETLPYELVHTTMANCIYKVKK